MAAIIDAHVHLWRYEQGPQFDWVSDGMAVLKQDFLPQHLDQNLKSAGVHGALLVQAQQKLQETEWMIELAENNPTILGVVGWAPLMSDDIAQVLARLAAAPRLKGLRHMSQGEVDGFMLRDDFNRGIDSMQGTGLVYELLIHERQLTESAEFVKRHPGQSFVLDHLAKPNIRAGEIEPWRKNLIALANAGDVCCKISGLVTEADWNDWKLDGLRPYLDAAFEAFGPERLMAASDWPVCLLAGGYERWWDALRVWLEVLSSEEREQILGGTAQRVYRL